jgi:predicted O-linked N-acetylglucosamine transferase (SPINDLY family)
MYGGDWRGFEFDKALIDRGVRAGQKIVEPFVYQAISDSPQDLLACAQTHASLFPPGAPLWKKSPRRRGKIRVGYLSGEFGAQATQYLAAGLYERHDRENFEIIAFDAGEGDQNPMRARLEAAFDSFIPISRLTDQEAAERIRDAQIDILVNLNGYFGRHRMGVFAQRPAPIQVNYLGFPGTLGAPYLDYILADRIVIPDAERRYFTEQVIWLPDCYQVNDDKRRIADRRPTRSEEGLPETGFVFCNFNQSYKLVPDTFVLWARLLKQVEGSVLWLMEGKGAFAQHLRQEAERQGVAGERLVFAQNRSLDQHLARLALADLFLDSLPYNAHTTASDALWAGVPLLTCRGRAFAGRVAASLLGAIGLPELITEDWAAYEALALKLAREPDLLRGLRDRLAQNHATHPLFDTDRFRRHIESAYRQIWEIAERGEAPNHFAVPA